MDDSHWFRNHPYYEESNISKNPNNPEGKPIPLRGEFYESRTSDILNKAKILREQHQNDIDKKLIADMQTALKDTENFRIKESVSSRTIWNKR